MINSIQIRRVTEGVCIFYGESDAILFYYLGGILNQHDLLESARPNHHKNTNMYFHRTAYDDDNNNNNNNSRCCCR